MRMSAEFVDVSSARKSEVWNFFLLNKSEAKAQCELCSEVLKASCGTKSLINHLNNKHEITIKRCNNNSGSAIPEKVARRENDEVGKESIGEVIARLVSVDGLNFNQIATSYLIRRAFKKDGYDLPKSPQTVRELFIKEYRRTLNGVVEKIVEEKSNSKRFSISFDEATTARNRRYLNINLHGEKNFHSLGMVRVDGNMPAERTVDLVKGRLEKFNLSLDNDITATVTDGASVMTKFGRLTSPTHVLCLAHAMHLSVCDVLYQQRRSALSSIIPEEVEDDEEDELPAMIVPEYDCIIDKVRKVSRIFRKSPVRNDENLQPQVVLAYGKELQLILDNRIRWNSLLLMVRRFLKLQKEAKLAMVSMDMEFPFVEEELQALEDLCECLTPMEVAVKYLCKESADLLLAERVISYALNKLTELDTSISLQLKRRIETRVKERRNTTLFQAINYLDNPNYLNEVTDNFGERIQKSEIKRFFISLLIRLFDTNYTNENSTALEVNSTNVSTSSSSSTEQQICEEIDSYISSFSVSSSSGMSTLNDVIRKEMGLFELTNSRPENLEKVRYFLFKFFITNDRYKFRIKLC